ncbi:hypothetical protein ABPG75_001536 [Micractinium tetrahymenae]
MLLSPRQFSSPGLEEGYQQERRAALAARDMRSAALFVALWMHECWSFLGRASVGALVKATVWLIAVGLKPVYVHWIVGPEFYQQYRAWIITFTKTVFAMHPPGEHLHLETLAALPTGGAGAAGAPHSPTLPRLLWLMASGAHLPYMLVTGLGWQDVLYNVPIQLALVGRSVRDMHAQCATTLFQGLHAQRLLRGLADQLTALLAAVLHLGTGIRGMQPTFPASLDPCLALGSWAAICFGFLLTTVALATGEHRARAEFARRHASSLTPAERQRWVDSGAGTGGWMAATTATAGLLAFACLLVWQVLVSLLTWDGGRLMGGA